MLRWMYGRKTDQRRTGVDAIGLAMRRCRLRWYGHIEGKANWVRMFHVGGEGHYPCRQAEEDSNMRL